MPAELSCLTQICLVACERRTLWENLCGWLRDPLALPLLFHHPFANALFLSQAFSCACTAREDPSPGAFAFAAASSSAFVFAAASATAFAKAASATSFAK